MKVMNGCAPGLALLERLRSTPKWAIHIAGDCLFWTHEYLVYLGELCIYKWQGHSFLNVAEQLGTCWRDCFLRYALGLRLGFDCIASNGKSSTEGFNEDLPRTAFIPSIEIAMVWCILRILISEKNSHPLGYVRVFVFLRQQAEFVR